jgi:hypothetical protein
MIRRIFGDVRSVAFLFALIGGLAAGTQATLLGDEAKCPVSAGACTRSCYLGGCGCESVGCNGGVCEYSDCCGGCSTCNGQDCNIEG